MFGKKWHQQQVQQSEHPLKYTDQRQSPNIFIVQATDIKYFFAIHAQIIDDTLGLIQGIKSGFSRHQNETQHYAFLT